MGTNLSVIKDMTVKYNRRANHWFAIFKRWDRLPKPVRQKLSSKENDITGRILKAIKKSKSFKELARIKEIPKRFSPKGSKRIKTMLKRKEEELKKNGC